MSELYNTVPQREIQAAVGAVISLAKYRELLRNRRAENRNGHPGKFRKWPFFWWALKGLNLRLPPCEDEQWAFLPVTAA